MNPDRQQAIQYARAGADCLWRWADHGSVLVWHDGTTLAFKEEILQILESLAPDGLPPLGALVLLLAACRGKVPVVDDFLPRAVNAQPPRLDEPAAFLGQVRLQLSAQLQAALRHLEGVSRLPEELRSGLRARCMLAEAVFECARTGRQAEAGAVLRGLREPIDDAELLETEGVGEGGSPIRHIHIVTEGLKRHTAESLALRLRTSLDALPREPDLKAPAAERARRLIDELGRDGEWGAVGRFARQLLAVVRLPRRLAVHEEFAVGGLSDIANRGPLDRLLVSELAHDDLTLAVRVALNEALYLRREPPRREPPGKLALLLDSGVRMWGVPRALAAAVALALIARDKHHSEVLAWRAHGRELAPVDLLTRDGLIRHLGALETSAHPGDSFPALAAALAPGPENQAVVITHPDALADPGFRRALADHPAVPGFVATVDRDGRFELHALPWSRRPALCEADLDLETILEAKTGVAPVRRDVAADLPAIFGVSPFPFLLPLAGEVSAWTGVAPLETHAVLNDRQLVRFSGPRFGGRVLADNLPGGRTLWMERIEGTEHAVKAGSSRRPARLLSWPLPDGPLRVVDLAGGAELLSVHACGEVLLAIRRPDVRAYSLRDGRWLTQTINPHEWLHGPYFCGTKQIYAVAWTGERVVFEPLPPPGGRLEEPVATVFNRPGREGPWILTRRLTLISAATGARIPLPVPRHLHIHPSTARVSRDGQRLFMNTAGPLGCLLTLGENDSVSFNLCPASRLDPPPALPSRNIFRAVDTVAPVRDGLAFRGRKGRWRKVTLGRHRKLQVVELTAHEASGISPQASFEENAHPAGNGVTLRCAAWPGGSKAFLDNRGLLHLKSPEPDAPEVSLVLVDGEVAGWTSAADVCGPPFFFEAGRAPRPDIVFDRLMRILTAV